MYIYDNSHNTWYCVTRKPNKCHNIVEQSLVTMWHSKDMCYGAESEMYIYDKSHNTWGHVMRNLNEKALKRVEQSPATM